MPARGLINYPRQEPVRVRLPLGRRAAAAVEIEMDTAVQDRQGDSYGRRRDRRYAIKKGAIHFSALDGSELRNGLL